MCLQTEMGAKKVKYRDIVKKPKGPTQIKSSNKRKPTGKFNKNKRYHRSDESNPETSGRVEKVAEIPESSSEEEQEELDYLQLLRQTFGTKIKDIKEAAVSSESSESETKSDVEKDQDDSDEDLDSDEPEEDDDEEVDDNEDPFDKHTSYELHPKFLENLQSNPVRYENQTKIWPKLGTIKMELPECPTIENETTLLDETVYARPTPIFKPTNVEQIKIRDQLQRNLKFANKTTLNDLTQKQTEILSIIGNYQDFYSVQPPDDDDEYRFTVCLHTLNHVLKTRTKIVQNNTKLTKNKEEECRDQGLVRPKVLILVPFKATANKYLNIFANLMFGDVDKGQVINRKRFTEEFTGNELYFPKKNPKPDDYVNTFAGNTDDNFKIGMAITKKSLKLYTDFYASDIIIASPLGLRPIIGAPGEPERDFDFLTSIELLVLDQTDIFLMQNWAHLDHIFEHLHLKPKELHGTDVSRVRPWSLNLCAKYYRQTIILSSISFPLLESKFKRECVNFNGRIKVEFEPQAVISKVYVLMQHVFRRFSTRSATEMMDRRFEFFIQEILPGKKSSDMKGTLIYIPCYFDYVRIRNYFNKEDMNFVQICEYTKEAKVARARDMFYHGDAHFMLYTERYHFYNRKRVKGIRHLIFYQPPNYPNFYAEICNLMAAVNMNKKIGSMDNMSVTIIYTSYDLIQLSGIVGKQRAKDMILRDRDIHMILTEGH